MRWIKDTSNSHNYQDRKAAIATKSYKSGRKAKTRSVYIKLLTFRNEA